MSGLPDRRYTVAVVSSGHVRTATDVVMRGDEAQWLDADLAALKRRGFILGWGSENTWTRHAMALDHRQALDVIADKGDREAFLAAVPCRETHGR